MRCMAILTSSDLLWLAKEPGKAMEGRVEVRQDVARLVRKWCFTSEREPVEADTSRWKWAQIHHLKLKADSTPNLHGMCFSHSSIGCPMNDDRP